MIRHIRTLSLIGVALCLAACSRTVDIKIGVAAPMSGPSAPLGKDIVQGAMIAIDELNTSNFRVDGKRAQFTLVVEDDQAQEAPGKLAAQRLIDAGVAAVFGHLNSHVSIAAAPLYANAGIPQLSVATNPRYTRMGLKTAFRIVADDIEQGATLGRLIVEKLRAKSVYVIDDGSTYGIGLAKEVSKRMQGTKIEAERESIEAQQADYALLAQKIIASKAEVVFYGGDEVIGVPLLQSLRKFGSQVRFVAGDGMCDINTLENAVGTSGGNFYCSIPGIPPSWLSSGIGFVQMYKSRFGEPGQYAPLAYDAVHVFAQAMQRGRSSDPHSYRKELLNGAFSGKVQGAIEFDEKGDMKEAAVIIYKAVGSKLLEQRNLL